MVKEYHTSLLEGPPEPTKRNPAIIIMTQLLTPSDVAELLQISVRTVYDHARRLGGFYPGVRYPIYVRIAATGDPKFEAAVGKVYEYGMDQMEVIQNG